MNKPTDIDPEKSFMNEFQMALINENADMDLPGPFEPLPGSTILGEADPSLLRHFGLLYRVEQEAKKLRALVGQQDNPQAREKAMNRFRVMESKYEAIRLITQIETGRRFPQLWAVVDEHCMLYIFGGKNIAYVISPVLAAMFP